jgi:hypothetical protein
MTPRSSPPVTMRIASRVTAITVLIAGGFSLAGLIRPKSILLAGSAPTHASFIFGMYAAARTIPLVRVPKTLDPTIVVMKSAQDGA